LRPSVQSRVEANFFKMVINHVEKIIQGSSKETGLKIRTVGLIESNGLSQSR